MMLSIGKSLKDFERNHHHLVQGLHGRHGLERWVQMLGGWGLLALVVCTKEILVEIPWGLLRYGMCGRGSINSVLWNSALVTG